MSSWSGVLGLLLARELNDLAKNLLNGPPFALADVLAAALPGLPQVGNHHGFSLHILMARARGLEPTNHAAQVKSFLNQR